MFILWCAQPYQVSQRHRPRGGWHSRFGSLKINA
nr:MAG TPA: Caspase 8 [Caudoviricetes sp.]